MMEQPPQSNAPRRQQYLLAAVVAAIILAIGYKAYSPRFAAQPMAETAAAVKPVDLNRADRAELIQVPGIGPNLADAILSHRAQAGRFESLDELRTVHGIGPKTLDKLKPWLTIEAAAVRQGDDAVVQLVRKPTVQPTSGAISSNKVRIGEGRIDVNTAGESDLVRLPGIGPALAGRIVAARDVKRFQTLEDLRKVRGIGAKTLENIRPFVVIVAQ